MYPERRTGRFVLAITIIILVTALFIPEAKGDDPQTRAPGDGKYDDPEIEVNIDSDVFYTQKMAFPDNTATVTGDITCVIPSYVPSNVWVKLTISMISTSLNYDGNKEYYATKEEPNVDYLITVYPKYNARAGETYSFEIQTLWTYSTRDGGSGTAESVSGEIEISPYGYIFMETVFQNPTMDIIIKQPFEVEFDLYNNGNSNCWVDLAVVETPPFTDVNITPSHVYLRSFTQTEINAVIFQEAGDEQEGTFRIRVLSDIPGAPTIDEFTFAIRSHEEEEKLTVDFSIAIASSFIIMFFIVMMGFIIYIRRLNKAKKEMRASEMEQDHYEGPEENY
jgi:hypothetical protein